MNRKDTLSKAGRGRQYVAMAPSSRGEKHLRNRHANKSCTGTAGSGSDNGGRQHLIAPGTTTTPLARIAPAEEEEEAQLRQALAESAALAQQESESDEDRLRQAIEASLLIKEATRTENTSWTLSPSLRYLKGPAVWSVRLGTDQEACESQDNNIPMAIGVPIVAEQLSSDRQVASINEPQSSIPKVEDDYRNRTTSSSLLLQTTAAASSLSSPPPRGNDTNKVSSSRSGYHKLERMRGYTRMYSFNPVTPTQTPTAVKNTKLPNNDPPGAHQIIADGSMPPQQEKQEQTPIIITIKTRRQQQQQQQVHQPQPRSTQQKIIRDPSSSSARNFLSATRRSKEQQDPSGRNFLAASRRIKQQRDPSGRIFSAGSIVISASRAAEILEELVSASDEEESNDWNEDDSSILLQEEEPEDEADEVHITCEEEKPEDEEAADEVYITCEDRHTASLLMSALHHAFGGVNLSCHDRATIQNILSLQCPKMMERLVAAGIDHGEDTDIASRIHPCSHQSHNTLSQVTEETLVETTSLSAEDDEDKGEEKEWGSSVRRISEVSC